MKSPDLSRAVDVQEDIAQFYRRHSCHAFAVDGAIETMRAPLPLGWLPTSTRVELADSNDYPLDPETVRLLTPFKGKLAGLGRETKYRIVVLEEVQNAPSALRVVLVPTSYEESTGFHLSLMEAASQRDDQVSSLKERWAAQLVGPGTYHLPGTAVVHAVVVTGDDRIVLCRRSPHTNYHPSHWSASFEEQINEKDQHVGGSAVAAAAIRGFREELVPDHVLAPEDVSVLGVFLEYGILNLGFCVQIQTSLGFDEIRLSWGREARDSWEAVSVVGQPFTIGDVVDLVRSGGYGTTSDEFDRFHPTSKYRLLMAAIRRFGLDAVTGTLK